MSNKKLKIGFKIRCGVLKVPNLVFDEIVAVFYSLFMCDEHSLLVCICWRWLNFSGFRLYDLICTSYRIRVYLLLLHTDWLWIGSQVLLDQCELCVCVCVRLQTLVSQNFL